MTGTYKGDTAGHRLVGKTSSQWQCDKCCNRGMYKVCTGTWRKDMQGFYRDLEERIYKSSRQKVSEKISRVRNILWDDRLYLYNTLAGGCPSIGHWNGSDLNSPRVNSKAGLEGLHASKRVFVSRSRPSSIMRGATVSDSRPVLSPRLLTGSTCRTLSAPNASSR